jgi:hypothetical protein
MTTPSPASVAELIARLREFPMFVRNGALWLMTTSFDPTCLEAAAALEALQEEIETRHIDFSEWATNVRTVALMKRCESMQQQRDAAWEQLMSPTRDNFVLYYLKDIL